MFSRRTFLGTARALLPVILATLVLPFSVFSQDSCRTGYASPAVTGNVSFGHPINWSSPNRAIISDNLYAQATLSAGDTSKYLRVKDFSFTLPATASIIGIMAKAERSMDASGNIYDASVKLSVNDVISGNEHKNASIWSSSDLSVEYGGVGDLWGLTLSPADVNSSNFGVLLSATRSSGTGVKKALVDDVALQIFFTVPGGTGCAPYFALPVTLLDFQVKYDKSSSSVLIEWRSANEVNNSHYTIERSANGVNFEEIAVVQGAGTSFHVRSYSYADLTPLRGTAYYRLKQTDFDGTSAMASDITSISGPKLPEFDVKIFPNPSSDLLTIEGLKDLNAEITLVNEGGQTIFKASAENSDKKVFDLSNQPRGVYFFELSSGKETIRRKVVLN